MRTEVTTRDASTRETAAEARRVYNAMGCLRVAAWRRDTLYASGWIADHRGVTLSSSPRRGAHLRRSSARGSAAELRRSFMSQKLFIGGLPFSTSTQKLSQLFSQVDGVGS
jgi:hypothetical protein